jgi:hypothetical protein
MHGILMHLLIDFESNIIAFETNIKGFVHDSNAATHLLSLILGPLNYALADPGYAGVLYVDAGLKSNQLKIPEVFGFSEQVLVEHINLFLKSCKVLSKKVAFKHSQTLHIACVVICCGWFNVMKLKFGAFERK